MQKDEFNIPGFKVERRLGSGGMASVFLAQQTSTKKSVALKIMSGELGEESVWAKRFIQEAQVIAQLTHPNVVPVYDVGSHEGQFYIAMELLNGGSLKEKMRQKIDIPQVLKIVAGIAAGLDYAAEKGFVHRDIKPDNIMFRDSGEPVILDFGIVKSMDMGPSKMTQTGTIIGTVAYMSPEQAQGHPLDQRSDIYSLGVVFYELLTQNQPYRGDTDVSTILKHISDPIPKLPDALNVFQPVIERAMAKDPFDRYTRAREIIDHIQSLEPDIKQALKRLKKPAAATVQMDAPTTVKGDATVVRSAQDMATKVAATKVVEDDDDDLTKVLSSAKATIRDFSVDSRKRKAKRTRNTILSAITVAFFALGYLGYHQMVLIPQEREAAEAKLREAQQKTQKKIDALLAEAKALRKSFQPNNLAQVDSIIAVYRQVLKLDPENPEADMHLSQLGERYVSLAQIAAERGDIAQADTYREYAEALVPNSTELPELREKIKNQRTQKLERRLVSEEIETLLEVAENEINNSSGFSDLAHTKIQQVLRIANDNPKALHLLSKMQENLYSDTVQALNKKQLNRAEANIELLDTHYPDKEKVKDIKARLSDLSSKASKHKALRDLLAKATQLEKEKRTISVNDQLRSVYKKVQSLSPSATQAKTGLLETSDFEAKLARMAIEELDFRRAQNAIDTISKTTPSYPGLASLKSSIDTKKADINKVNTLVQSSKTLLQKASNMVKKPDQHRQLLVEISQNLSQAKALNIKNKGIDKNISNLESAYIKAIQQNMAKKRYDEVEKYFEDSANMNWPSDRLLSLQNNYRKEAANKKKEHVITTGF